MKLRRTSSIATFGLAAAALLATAGVSTDAEARPNIKRRGGQWGVMLGGSVCVPGKAKCARESISDGGVTVVQGGRALSASTGMPRDA